jgi:hypothetical protein
MKLRAIALAAPLVFGAACMHTSKQSAGGTASAGQPAPQQPQASAGATGDVTQDPLFQPGPRVQGHAGDEVVAGRIIEVANDSLLVRTGQGEMRILILVPETEIQLDGRDASAADLAEGQPVAASFDVVEGQQVAVKVHAVAPSEQSGTGSGSDESGAATDRNLPSDQDESGTGSSGTPSSPGGMNSGPPSGEPHW